MSIVPLQAMESLLQTYGYLVVFVGIALESLGLPLPGESLMIAAALYAATTHRLDISVIVTVAAAGAIIGDQVGYFIGRWIGFRMLAKWGRGIGLTSERLALGRFLFHRYGGAIVFWGRYVALLRTFAAVLAGANRMPWHRFLVWNALGGIGWTCLYGVGAYLLGDAFKRISGPAGIVLALVGLAGLVAAMVFIKRNERGLIEQARQEMQRTDGNRH